MSRLVTEGEAIHLDHVAKSAKGVLLQKSGGRPERKGVASKSRDLRSDQRQKSQPCWPSGRQQE